MLVTQVLMPALETRGSLSRTQQVPVEAPSVYDLFPAWKVVKYVGKSLVPAKGPTGEFC